ncbi:MAG: DsbA family protein [Acidobacteria bacterium]|nr:DsbA family protein [Acidobacteriota bacterium]
MDIDNKQDATTPPQTRPSFVYVGDPMCSWCWGFAPTLERLSDHFSIEMETIVGGLRPGPDADILDDEMRSFILGHWRHVAEATGQPFDETGLDRDNWTYNTELPAIAVVWMRENQPVDTLRFFTRLQQAFYAEAVDITDASTYRSLLADFDVDVDEFTADIATADWKQRAWADFALSRSYGVHGFPTLLVRIGADMTIVTRGYAPFETLEPAITRFFRGKGVLTAVGEACAIDGADC